jgi:biotin carboxylase
VASVLLVGGRHPAAARAARQAGLRVHYLGARDGAPSWLEDEANAVTLIDNPDAESVTAAARHIYTTQPFDVAISMSDAYGEAVAVVNERLGLTANSPRTARTVSDKALMRGVLRDSGTAPVSAARITTGEQARRFPTEAGYPFVLKPVDGSGSRGVTLVPNEDSLAYAVAQTVGSGAGTWVAEEYLRGPEFSVETFSADGEHHFLAVTEKFKGANFVEVGHLVPARIAAEAVRALADATFACLDAVGVMEGPAHTELILTDKGPRIVETHARPGGDGIVELVRLATGLDAQKLTFDWLAGRPLDLDGARHKLRAAATWFLTPYPGTVADVGGLREVLMEDGVTEAYLTVAPGDVIGELRSSLDRAGAVIAAADTPDAALDRARLAAARLQVGITFQTAPAS